MFLYSNASGVKALKVIKRLLQVEKPKTGEGFFHRTDNIEETRIYSDLYTLSRVTYNSTTNAAQTRSLCTVSSNLNNSTISRVASRMGPQYLLTMTVSLITIFQIHKRPFFHIKLTSLFQLSIISTAVQLVTSNLINSTISRVVPWIGPQYLLTVTVSLITVFKIYKLPFFQLSITSTDVQLVTSNLSNSTIS